MVTLNILTCWVLLKKWDIKRYVNVCVTVLQGA